MQTDETFVNVILPLALGSFTYSVPNELVNEIAFGKRVVVQFGKKKIYTAIIINIHNQKPTAYETKSLISVIDQKPIITPIQLQFWQWIATYYLCTIGEVMKAAMPSGMKLESETIVTINQNFDDLENINPTEISIYEMVRDRKNISIEDLCKISSRQKIISLTKSLLDKGAIIISESLQNSYKPQHEDYVIPMMDLHNSAVITNIFQILKNAPQQQKLFVAYIQLFTEQSQNKIDAIAIKRKDLLKISGLPATTLKPLIEKGILGIAKQAISRVKSNEQATSPLKQLNEFQARAIEEIKQRFENQSICLLHGVTASGKTEIYIHLIDETLRSGRQVLYLLPEIALTAQIINRLKSVFGNQVGIYHSKFNDNERIETWQNVIDKNDVNNFKLILGVRSSIFLPFDNLGLIIVDEEHETSYKQFDPAPRYNARDAAIMLATMHKAKVLLGTATPSIETYYNARNGKYGLVELTKRHHEVELPEIKIVDTTQARKQNQMHSHFSQQLIDHIDEALKKQQQVILFQNRRGFSPYLECKTCGTIPKCIHCDVSLTYHKFTNTLVCHYCGYTIHNSNKCEVCGSHEIEAQGFGTEKIEDDIKIFFPDARVARMDLDTTRAKDAYSTLIEKFENRQIDILIGTQMISKGLDFENVSLVGIMNADSLLSIPDFRAFERSFQLMTQVSGRAGRSNKQGIVIIQTANPQHAIIADVIENNYQHLYATQLADRQKFQYPPFYRLIRLSLKHKDQSIVDDAAQQLANALRQVFGQRILGPEFPPVNRIQNLFIKNILIKIEKDNSFNKAKNIITKYIDILCASEKYKSVSVIANVDPY